MSALTMTPARILAALVGLAAIVAVAIAVWPDSAADRARADGEHLGQAVGSLYEAQSPADVDAAFADIHSALDDTRTHAGDELAEQLDKQADALNRAADGFVGSRTSDDGWDQDVYQSELDYAVDDLTGNADDFRDQRSDVRVAYWDGFQNGLPDELR
jgi:acyl-CoA reductase-like NAD-dependent aldehyde dehydrogenase